VGFEQAPKISARVLRSLPFLLFFPHALQLEVQCFNTCQMEFNMPIQVSNTLRKKLPENERNNFEQVLLAKAGGVCFLCAQKIVEATEKLVADHDVAEAEGGATNLANLNLVHEHCNSFKRSHPTVNVRPFLRLEGKIRAVGGFLKYDEAAALLGIHPQPVDVVIKGKAVEITTADGVTRKSPIFSETNKEGTYQFCYCELPPGAIFNDDECSRVP
jgi:hypothetical protein